MFYLLPTEDLPLPTDDEIDAMLAAYIYARGYVGTSITFREWDCIEFWTGPHKDKAGKSTGN